MANTVATRRRLTIATAVVALAYLALVTGGGWHNTPLEDTA